MDDLLGLLNSTPTPPAAPPGGGAADVMGMANLMGSPAMGLGASPAAAPGGFAPFTAWDKGGLKITFSCTKDPGNPSITIINAEFANATGGQFDGMNFQVAVPKYMKLDMKPPSSATVPPNLSGTTTQVFRVANSMHGQKPVLLKVKIEYSTMGQQISETGTVDQFPAGI